MPMLRTQGPRKQTTGPQHLIDLHVHAQWSADAIGDLDQLAHQARSKGLQGLCLTEHNTTRHHKPLRAWNRDHKDDDFRYFPGIEVSTRQGHVLAIGVETEIPAKHDIEETLETIRDAGGIGIPAHPHRRFTGIGADLLERLLPHLRLIETHNAQETPSSNQLAARFANTHGLSGTGGSDAHQVHDVANAYTVFQRPVEDLDTLLTELEQGRVHADGGRTRWATRWRQRARIARRMMLMKYP
jgi:predicted metal-dependent phosphoesterase TrpH